MEKYSDPESLTNANFAPELLFGSKYSKLDEKICDLFLIATSITLEFGLWANIYVF